MFLEEKYTSALENEALYYTMYLYFTTMEFTHNIHLKRKYSSASPDERFRASPAMSLAEILDLGCV